MNAQIPDDGPNLDDEFMRAAFDPAFKFAPLPPRSESDALNAQYAAMERSRDSMKLCPLCQMPPKVTATDQHGYPRQVEEYHADGCPAFGSD